jgi:AmiR/NasT family two-component response regulator
MPRLALDIIDEAKRKLMSKFNMSEPEAHKWLIDTAMTARRPKLDIALDVIKEIQCP